MTSKPEIPHGIELYADCRLSRWFVTGFDGVHPCYRAPNSSGHKGLGRSGHRRLLERFCESAVEHVVVSRSHWVAGICLRIARPIAGIDAVLVVLALAVSERSLRLFR